MRSKPTVGQTLYSLNIGNASRHQPQALTPVIVRKVGRKWFTCSRADDEPPYRATSYSLETWLDDSEGYSHSAQLYATEQEWLDQKEHRQLYEEIRKAFDLWTGRGSELSLATLRQIKALLNPV